MTVYTFTTEDLNAICDFFFIWTTLGVFAGMVMYDLIFFSISKLFHSKFKAGFKVNVTGVEKDG